VTVIDLRSKLLTVTVPVSMVWPPNRVTVSMMPHCAAAGAAATARLIKSAGNSKALLFMNVLQGPPARQVPISVEIAPALKSRALNSVS
jgi:hypothetical protein